MPSSNFTTIVHGKWLLAGEHAVIRGIPAIVFPILSKSFKLDYQFAQTTVAKVAGEHSEPIQIMFWRVTEHALELLQKPFQALQGVFNIFNLIPIGAGMGLSAALCSAVSRFTAWKHWIKPNEVFQFAKKLENLFHGESSGVDIAGSIARQGMLYNHSGELTPIVQHWQPQWYLSYVGQASITVTCVEKVKQLWTTNPKEASDIDHCMHRAVDLALTALQQPKNYGLTLLAKAINEAQQCFTRWGLVGENVQEHLKKLFAAGALAAKLTGSGNGGYIISLWDNTPPEALKSSMIAV